MDETCIIPSRFAPSDYNRSDFFTLLAFRNACESERIPLDKPIPERAWLLAGEAFHAGNRTCGPSDPAASALWEQARQAAMGAANG